MRYNSYFHSKLPFDISIFFLKELSENRLLSVRSFRNTGIGIFFSCLILTGLQYVASAQTTFPEKGVAFDIKFATAISEEGKLPFWLHSNRWGTIDRNQTNGYVGVTPRWNMGSMGNIDMKAGAELVSRVASENALFFSEVYLQADWQIFRFVGGRKKERIGITDSTLTSGSMIQSGNASPIPKIRIYTPDFVDIPGMDEWLSFKGYFAHGWMENGRYIEDPWLHQKYFYLKVLPERYPLQLFGGLVQSTLWAGTHPEYGDLPDSFPKDFWNIFTAQESESENAEPSATGEAVGSSIGIYDFGISYDYHGYSGIIHRQFYLETGAGAKFRNVWDGLWGVSISWDKEFQYVNKLSWSHLYTKRQSSQEHRGDPPYGADSYYSNSVYWSGWTYHGRTIGNPLMFSDGINPGVDNSIVISHQLSFEGEIGLLNYILSSTYSRNYGINNYCATESCINRSKGFTDRQDQYSFLLQTSMDIKEELSLNVDLAYDTGDLYPDQMGAMIGLMYRIR